MLSEQFRDTDVEMPAAALLPQKRPAESSQSFYPMAASFDQFVGHSRVALPGKVALLADIGAYNNLASSKWFESSIASAKGANKGNEIRQTQLPAPLSIAGVGKGTQQCCDQLTVPGRLKDGTDITFTAPVVPDSEFPGLLGLQSLDRMNAVFLQAK